MSLPQPACRLDPVAAGHAQVHEHDIGPGCPGQLDCFLAVGGSADDLDVLEQAEQGLEALPDDALVVGDQHADHRGIHNSTRNPPGVGPAVTVAPISSARSRMPVRP